VNITDEEGTVWWHAHSDFDRTTVHGALVIYPKNGTTYPFSKPDGEFILILGEWWNQDVTEVYKTALLTGADPPRSDANTINGQPGDFEHKECSAKGNCLFVLINCSSLSSYLQYNLKQI
jgi:laccase